MAPALAGGAEGDRALQGSCFNYRREHRGPDITWHRDGWLGVEIYVLPDRQRRNKLYFLIYFFYFPLPDSMERAGVARSVVCLGKRSLLLGDLGSLENQSHVTVMVCLPWCPSPADDAGKGLIMGSSVPAASSPPRYSLGVGHPYNVIH